MLASGWSAASVIGLKKNPLLGTLHIFLARGRVGPCGDFYVRLRVSRVSQVQPSGVGGGSVVAGGPSAGRNGEAPCVGTGSFVIGSFQDPS